jgi:hypothetical protein
VSVEKLALKQKAVLWAFSTYDANGDPVVSAAEELSVRWEQRKTESIDAQGAPIALNAKADVDQDVTAGSIMWLGELRDLPTSPTDLHEVVDFNKIPDIKGREFKRTATLRKWKGTLPSIV